jgi:1,4-alpha-glucan branching enzyme
MARVMAGVASPPPGSLEDRTMRQAARELMLLQGSDWPFAITNGTTEVYAKRRFFDHLARFHDLLNEIERHQVDEGKLTALEQMDAILPELEYQLYSA